MQKQIVAALAREIASGRFAPLSTLPRESDLCGEFGVSRTVIREALKVLESKGLVRGRPRVGTFVRDRSEWHILDPDLVGWIGADVVDFEFLESLLEARKAIEPVVAELAAERSTAQDVADLDLHWQRMVAALPDDLPAFAEADVAFHTTLFRASRNPVFTQLSGVIHWAMKKLFETESAAATSHEEALSLHHAVIEALRLRDKKAARRAIDGVLAGAERDLRAARQQARIAKAGLDPRG
ncbi:FadR/GntR family transcriptional regulator [Geminicoccus roseus]|uniref:FadR/GntR family transcriptional regulator n=1 Tax=Geminicoccus roseus TaxID=404900 RepID=UPI00040B0178|nr:FadR/GntR family transcriptional regulator [Geminicoccus roseus]